MTDDAPPRLKSVFRAEALAHFQRRLDGDVILATPLPLRILSALCLGALVAAIVFACAATYSSRVTVTGWIVPDRGLIRADAAQAGTVAAIYVKEGQRVNAGAALAAIKLSTTIRGGDAGEMLSRALRTEVAAQAAQTDAARDRLASEQTGDRKRLDNLRGQLAEARRRTKLADDQQRLAAAEVERLRPIVAMKYISQAQMDTLEVAALAAAQASSQARSTALDLEKQINDAQAALDASLADLAGLKAQSAQARAALAQRGTVNEANNLLIVTAQISGRVAALAVSPGQALAAGATVALLTPADSRLIAEVFVPSRSAGFIHAGEAVQLMYQSFPFETFGTGAGRVAAISSAILAPSDVSVPGLSLAEPVFRARVALSRQAVTAYGQSVPLRPGMLLSADLIVARRNLLQWLFDPVYAAAGRQ